MVQNYQEGPMISQPRKRNTLATVGFVLSFLTGPIGGAISIAALIQVTKTGEKGKGLAIAGIVIGFAGIIFLVVISVLFSTLIWPSVKNNITKSSYCSQAFSCVDNGDGTSTCKYCLDNYCMEVEEVICEN